VSQDFLHFDFFIQQSSMPWGSGFGGTKNGDMANADFGHFPTEYLRKFEAVLEKAPTCY
jgi:hypothetical protein